MQTPILDKGDYNDDQTVNQSSAGFTIVETCIAMLIMFVAVLGSVSVFAYSIKNNSGATDRELAMAVAQKQMEQLRNVTFTDASLDETSTDGLHSSLERAGRSYLIRTNVGHSNVVNGAPTVKTITLQVAPTGTSLGAVTLRAVRTTKLTGPNR